MFRRKIRPAEEEMNGTLFSAVFLVMWYAALGANIAGAGFQIGLILFLIAGLLPLFMMIQNIRRAMFYRRQNRRIREYGDAARGRIVNVVIKHTPYEDNSRRTRYKKYYYLQVEVADPMTGVVNKIESQAYSRPVYRMLSSPEVTVYTDRTGWKHYIDDFHYKERRSDPGIFGEPRVFDENGTGAMITKALVIVIMVLMVLSMFFR